MCFFKSEVSLTSSTKLGRILRICRRSENFGSTPTNPLRKLARSSFDLDAKLEGSRKSSVEVARFEKNGWEGKLKDVSRDAGVRVMSWERRAACGGKRSGGF